MSTITETPVRPAGSEQSPDRLPRTAVLVGSTRVGRAGDAVAGWFVGWAERQAELDVDVIDLGEFDFPLRYPARPTPAMSAFTGRVAAADAFVVVTPEYNHGYPASLKQAVDFACDEWFAKPAGFVSYGTTGQGLRAVEQLRLVFAALHMVTVPEVVSFNLFDGSVTDDGLPRDLAGAGASAERMVAQLTWWALALRSARNERPYAA